MLFAALLYIDVSRLCHANQIEPRVFEEPLVFDGDQRLYDMFRQLGVRDRRALLAIGIEEVGDHLRFKPKMFDWFVGRL